MCLRNTSRLSTDRNWICNLLEIDFLWTWFWEWQFVELSFWIRESNRRCPPRGLPRTTTSSSINDLTKTGQLSIVWIQTLFHLLRTLYAVDQSFQNSYDHSLVIGSFYSFYSHNKRIENELCHLFWFKIT